MVVLLTAPMLAGCIIWDAPRPRFSILNETDARLRVETGFGDEILVGRAGGLNGFVLEECRRVRVEAFQPDGRLVASRQSACPDQVWVIVDRGCVAIRPNDTPALRTRWDRKRLGCRA
jgi:hypothetical protein